MEYLRNRHSVTDARNNTPNARRPRNLELNEFPLGERLTETQWNLKYKQFLRMVAVTTELPICEFCTNNRQPIEVCVHSLHDENRKVTCPVLYKHVCTRCGATGEQAHTKKHCPIAQQPHYVQQLCEYNAATNMDRRSQL